MPGMDTWQCRSITACPYPTTLKMWYQTLSNEDVDGHHQNWRHGTVGASFRVAVPVEMYAQELCNRVANSSRLTSKSWFQTPAIEADCSHGGFCNTPITTVISPETSVGNQLGWRFFRQMWLISAAYPEVSGLRGHRWGFLLKLDTAINACWGFEGPDSLSQGTG